MPSPFASTTTSDPIPLPFDAGQTITVRTLTGRQHEAAQQIHRAGFVAGNDWAAFFRRSAEFGPTSNEVKRILADPLTGYDRYELVRAGLAAWSYAHAIPPYVNAEKHAKEVEADPLKKDVIDDLHDDAVDYIARAVLKRAKPLLFVETPKEAEDAKVKG